MAADRDAFVSVRPNGREVVVDDAAGLAWIVNLGCIELHPHPVRTSDLEHPNELRMSLDPVPVSAGQMYALTLEVQSLLEVRGWPKTSGCAWHSCERAHC